MMHPFQQHMHMFYTYLQPQENAHQFLLKCYQSQPGIDAKRKAMENCSTFTYYLDHGRQFILNGKQAPLFMQPILLFYGISHLLKACLLTKRPDYPESTTILAHGVSTRKRKKKQYSFLLDEVKIQYNGLFPYAAKHLYILDHFPFDKINMEKMLKLIPEMNELFLYQKREGLQSIGTAGSNELLFKNNILDHYHLTGTAFIKRIAQHTPEVKTHQLESDVIRIVLTNPIQTSFGPFFIHQESGEIFFPKDRQHFLAMPETLLHYLLLYNLSMISRYETEWWGELITAKTEADYAYIKHFLTITANKILFLIGTELQNMDK